METLFLETLTRHPYSSRRACAQIIAKMTHGGQIFDTQITKVQHPSKYLHPKQGKDKYGANFFQHHASKPTSLLVPLNYLLFFIEIVDLFRSQEGTVWCNYNSNKKSPQNEPT